MIPIVQFGEPVNVLNAFLITNQDKGAIERDGRCAQPTSDFSNPPPQVGGHLRQKGH